MTSRDLPTTVVLHLGAHKTASTHLQHSVYAAALGDDIAFLGPRDLRDHGMTLPERFGFPLNPRKANAMKTRVDDALQQIACGASRLVLSEENFAGRLQMGWGRIPRPLYATAPERIGALAKTIADAGGPPLDLCLAIRDPAEYLTSSYSQILHGRRVVQPDKFRAKNPIGMIDWVDYVRRLRAVPGVGTLTLWRYEDYIHLFAQICMALLGTDHVAPLAGRAQQRISTQAMAAILQAKSLGAVNVVAEAAAAYPVSATCAPFDLYDATEHAESNALYAAQWAQLTGMQGVTALRVSNA